MGGPVGRGGFARVLEGKPLEGFGDMRNKKLPEMESLSVK